MATDLAEAVAGCPLDLLHYGRDISDIGHAGLLDSAVQWYMVYR